jgi:4-amino-4-deoxy-L-arabinose transferase-like glycosyltransferase
MATNTTPAAPPATAIRAPAHPSRWRRLRARARRTPRPLALLLAVAALQSLAWDVALPAFQGPDEDTHFAYVQHLAETGEVPSATTGGSAYSSEEEEALVTLNLLPLIGDPNSRPAWSEADLKAWHAVERTINSAGRANGAGPNPIAKNPPLYYAAMSIPYRLFLWLPLLKRLFVMRLFNALCYLATIAMTWLLAGELFGSVRWKQLLAAATVALEPQLSFMSAVINADNLLIALCTAVLLASVRLVTRGPSMARVLTASALTAAAILTHGRGLVTLPVLAVALLVAWVKFRPSTADALRRAAAAAATVGVAFLAYVAFGRGGGSLYGGQITELNSKTSFNLRQFASSIYEFYFPRLLSMQPRLGPAYGYKQVFIDTFYGSFGWLEVKFTERIYDVLQLLSALGLVGLYTAVVARWRRLWVAWPVVAVMLTLLATNLLFLHYVSYRALLSDNGADPLIVGRYLLPMVSLFGLAIAFTLGSLPRRLGPPMAALVLALGVLLSLGGIGITVVRFYA